MSDRTRYIASVSWGKDSLAMLHGLIEREMPLHEVVFYNIPDIGSACAP